MASEDLANAIAYIIAILNDDQEGFEVLDAPAPSSLIGLIIVLASELQAPGNSVPLAAGRSLPVVRAQARDYLRQLLTDLM
jgi:hypothetical protein